MGRHTAIVEEARRERGAALMGVLNVTPDSFYDGGRYLGIDLTEERIRQLIAQGADILDIGGESTQPRSEPVPAAEQILRIERVVQCAVNAKRGLVSVDTSSPEVARCMLEHGAHVVNDVSCLAQDDLARIAARFGATLIIMHSRGPMRAMAGFSEYPDHGYEDIVEEVRREWRAARDRAVAAGMPREDVWFDPGIGFNKNAWQSYELLARLDEFQSEGVPVVVGPSRKSFIAATGDASAEERLGGTIAACLMAVERRASVLRVHDVFEVRQALAVASAVRSPASVRTPRG